MFLKDAREIARQWVTEEAESLPHLHGAYFAGSTTWLPDHAVLPPTSDLDINLVLADSSTLGKRGKFIYKDVLMELTYLSVDQVRSPEIVLSDYHLAGGFRTHNIILDPTGQLTELQAKVASDFAQRRWVRQRCGQARDKILAQLASLNAAAPFHDQVIGWIFPTGVTTHILLAAGLKNPTVRNRYYATQQLLAEYGHMDHYETLLTLLGCARMTPQQVEEHLAALTRAFDAATAVLSTPVDFASDISEIARPIVIEGSRDLIARGYHREAVFWMLVTYSRCRKVLYNDGSPATIARFDPAFRRLLGDLGITSFSDLQQRGEQLQEVLPHVWNVAEAIIAANPEIKS
ncbi:MAG: hypothetical protein M3506_02820 [Chloroflexota bacterium]|nr:hypothetical protein [Chloroflexota bacterium]